MERSRRKGVRGRRIGVIQRQVERFVRQLASRAGQQCFLLIVVSKMPEIMPPALRAARAVNTAGRRERRLADHGPRAGHGLVVLRPLTRRDDGSACHPGDRAGGARRRGSAVPCAVQQAGVTSTWRNVPARGRRCPVPAAHWRCTAGWPRPGTAAAPPQLPAAGLKPHCGSSNGPLSSRALARSSAGASRRPARPAPSTGREVTEIGVTASWRRCRRAATVSPD